MRRARLVPHALALRALLSALLLVSCARRKDDVRPRAAAAAAVLAFNGAHGFALTLFDDCHLECDGEDSVRLSRPYAFDPARGMIWTAGERWAELRDGGLLLEVNRGTDNLWNTVEDQGRWVPIPGAPARGIPSRCRCVGSACGVRSSAVSE